MFHPRRSKGKIPGTLFDSWNVFPMTNVVIGGRCKRDKCARCGVGQVEMVCPGIKVV